MQVRPTEIEVDADDPFKNDVLGRKELEPTLTTFVSLATGSLVMALDGPWGSGKTTFLKMWEQCLKNRGHASVYLNAWTSDFATDPLVPLVAELSQQVATQLPALKKHLDQVKKVGISILKRAIPAALQLATAGVLKAEDLTEAKLGELAGQIAEDQIKSYEEAKSAAEKFRSILGKIAQKVADTGAGNKIIVIIDELDRCRPTHAVELLERMKHLFNVEGVIFVLGIDRAQLSHSIKALYGSEFDASGYLKRFIDIDYQLPSPEEGVYGTYLLEKLGVGEVLRNREPIAPSELPSLASVLTKLFELVDFGLRHQDQVVGRLRVVIGTIPINQHLFGEVLCALLVLREWRRDFYDQIDDGTVDIDAILAELTKRHNASRSGEENDWNLVQGTLLAIGLARCKKESPRLNRYKVRNDSRFSFTESESSVFPLVTSISTKGDARDGGVLATLRRISLTESFVISDRSGQAQEARS